MKKILAVYYTQTGQLYNALNSVLEPLRNSSDIEITELEIKPKKIFPFPWPFFEFIDAFPESVALEPCEIEPIALDKNEKYDLIILAYQVWYLNPSQPITAFLQSKYAASILKDTPVITLIGCRNMWLNAQEVVKGYLNTYGAELIGNIALVDKGSTAETFYTTPKWLLTGEKNFKYLTPAGISEDDIKGSSRFGKAILEKIKNELKLDQTILQGLNAVKVDAKLIGAEKTGIRAFKIWSKIIRKIGKPGDKLRRLGLIVWFMCLLIGIVTVVPISALIRKFFAISNSDQYQKLKEKYELPSGSDNYNIDKYTSN